ncbi:hypothetical protein BDZ90DRAFT_124579 [Jaminaea rosea]|uniref:Uncharacterized protein n=1 Tax=Jaminaea rosea TaxID=1569628 RepID=A0A316UGR5_9BASI|nr:hypothetical protein BDZ90DRAFT_124579 [Jaminaea rosea]PWN24452.1 hypothetical protein BDZ90DRAFT_124579 [Jaminaea rosea]
MYNAPLRVLKRLSLRDLPGSREHNLLFALSNAAMRGSEGKTGRGPGQHVGPMLRSDAACSQTSEVYASSSLFWLNASYTTHQHNRHMRLAIAYVLVAALMVQADHYTCNWQDQGVLSPATYGYELYCRASAKFLNTTNAEYYCPAGPGYILKVADYGFLAPETLEIRSPCAKNGFANDCSWLYWGVCDAPSDQKSADPFHCKYLGRHDDCSWPTKFAAGTEPATLDIWRKK